MNGADAGGAIFTVGGALTITNSTIAGNESTGDGAGVVAYKPLSGEATSLVLRNTIVAGNTGRDECFVLGGVATSGTNNLVTPHATDARTACPAITQTADPQLGALALNAPGRTPTMAIDATSPAFNTGDLAFAPTDDQRGVSRPRFGAADIGAYEYVGGTDFTAPHVGTDASRPARASTAGTRPTSRSTGAGPTASAVRASIPTPARSSRPRPVRGARSCSPRPAPTSPATSPPRRTR